MAENKKASAKRTPRKASAKPKAAAKEPMGDRVYVALRKIVQGVPLETLRRTLPKRTAPKTPRPMWARVSLGALAAVLLTWFALSFVELVQNPGNPAWWALAWAFGVPAFATVGVLFRWVPTGARAMSLMSLVYVLGFFALPYTAALLTGFNALLLILVAIFGSSFALAGHHYLRVAALHREGFQV